MCFNHSGHFPTRDVENMNQARLLGTALVLGLSFRMRLLLETERKKRKRGANGNDSFLNKLIQGAYIAQMQSSVKLLDFPRLCKHEGKSLYVGARMLQCLILCDNRPIGLNLSWFQALLHLQEPLISQLSVDQRLAASGRWVVAPCPANEWGCPKPTLLPPPRGSSRSHRDVLLSPHPLPFVFQCVLSKEPFPFLFPSP